MKKTETKRDKCERQPGHPLYMPTTETKTTLGDLFADRYGQIYNHVGKTVAITYKDAEPELLEALKAAHAAIGRSYVHNGTHAYWMPTLDVINAAIAKAEGR